MIIAVDGPSASGKGTLARAIAREMGYHYLDTGTLYRMVGLAMLQANMPPEDAQTAAQFALNLDIDAYDDASLRGETVAAMASQVAQYPAVRQALLDLQRSFAKRQPGAVLDGRDIGTVICPDADLKFFVTARPDLRAQRRLKELEAMGLKTDFEAVLAAVTARDLRDAARTLKAPDAVVVDSSDYTIAELREQVLEIVRKKVS
jgi:CMP/dCMP kinase